LPRGQRPLSQHAQSSEDQLEDAHDDEKAYQKNDPDDDTEEL
jgi:hypothetical protein